MRNSGNYIYDCAHSFFRKDFEAKPLYYRQDNKIYLCVNNEHVAVYITASMFKVKYCQEMRVLKIMIVKTKESRQKDR